MKNLSHSINGGFTYAWEYGIRYHDLPSGYYVKDEDVEEFDKDFPPKEKLRLPVCLW